MKNFKKNYDDAKDEAIKQILADVDKNEYDYILVHDRVRNCNCGESGAVEVILFFGDRQECRIIGVCEICGEE